MQQENKAMNRSSQRMIYAALMFILLISHSILIAFQGEHLHYPMILLMFRIIIAILGIWLGKLWQDKGFLLVSGFFLWQIIRVAMKGIDFFFSDTVSSTIFNGMWAILGCYALSRVLPGRQLKRFLRIFVLAWTIGITIHCIIAIYAAWTDQVIWNFSGGSFWGIGDTIGSGTYQFIQENAQATQGILRLYICLYPTVAGSYLSLSGIVALCCLLAEKNKGFKVFYGIAYILMIIALSLTDTRASIISLSAGVGVMTCAVVLWLYRKRKKGQAEEKKLSLISWAVAILCMAGVFVLSTILIMKITPVYNARKTGESMIISSARAEEFEKEEEKTITTRALTNLSGRDEIWRNVIQYLKENPKILILGESVYNPIANVNQRFSQEVGHCHNIALQIILESGIVGFLIILSFGIYTAVNAFRILNSRTFPLWIRLVPAVAATVLVGDLAECFTWFQNLQSLALPFLFIAAGIINNAKYIEHIEETFGR